MNKGVTLNVRVGKSDAALEVHNGCYMNIIAQHCPQPPCSHPPQPMIMQGQYVSTQ